MQRRRRMRRSASALASGPGGHPLGAEPGLTWGPSIPIAGEASCDLGCRKAVNAPVVGAPESSAGSSKAPPPTSATASTHQLASPLRPTPTAPTKMSSAASSTSEPSPTNRRASPPRTSCAPTTPGPTALAPHQPSPPTHSPKSSPAAASNAAASGPAAATYASVSTTTKGSLVSSHRVATVATVAAFARNSADARAYRDFAEELSPAATCNPEPVSPAGPSLRSVRGSGTPWAEA